LDAYQADLYLGVIIPDQHMIIVMGVADLPKMQIHLYVLKLKLLKIGASR
jgi:hypothetical protein